jgi:hypothetical protein
MKLIGELKEKVEQAESKEEVRETIAQAGILLDDEELENVAGGVAPFPIPVG